MSELREAQFVEGKNRSGATPVPLPASEDEAAARGKPAVDADEEILSLLRKILANQKADIARRRRGVRTSLTLDFIALLAFVVFVVLLLWR